MVEQVPLPDQGPGLSGLQDVFRGMRAAFPDVHWAVEEQIATATMSLITPNHALQRTAADCRGCNWRTSGQPTFPIPATT